MTKVKQYDRMNIFTLIGWCIINNLRNMVGRKGVLCPELKLAACKLLLPTKLNTVKNFTPVLVKKVAKMVIPADSPLTLL